MSTIRIESTGSATLDRVNKLLAGVPGGVWKATSSALKRAAGSAKTKAGQFAAAEYTINKGTFMANTTVKTRVSGGSGGVAGVSISYGGSVLPLLTFNTRFGKGGNVVTQVKRNGGGATLAHAFVASIFGSTAVFERVGAPRFPVEKLYGPSTGHMMQNETVIEKMDETIEKTFSERMEHEILRVLNGWGG